MQTSDRRRQRPKLDTKGTKAEGFTIDKHKRFWQVIDSHGRLVCLTVYRCGAKEVVRRLSG